MKLKKYLKLKNSSENTKTKNIAKLIIFLLYGISLLIKKNILINLYTCNNTLFDFISK